MKKKYVELLEEYLPPKRHKMYKAWKQYALNAIERGKLVKEMVSKFIQVENATVIDIGCGEGGLSIAFAKENSKVLSLDIDPERVKRSKIRAEEEGVEVNFVVADGLRLPFRSFSFDIIICNDLIEHVPEPQRLMEDCNRVLKKGGILYLQTPNRMSPYEIIHDSHYGLFGVSLMSYSVAKWYVTKVRKVVQNYEVYKLLSYRCLEGLFKRFDFKVYDCHNAYYSTKKRLFTNPLIKRLQVLKYFLPTFVFICRKHRLTDKVD